MDGAVRAHTTGLRWSWSWEGGDLHYRSAASCAGTGGTPFGISELVSPGTALGMDAACSGQGTGNVGGMGDH